MFYRLLPGLFPISFPSPKVSKINSFLKDFLDEKVAQYNQPNFIESDPIQIPHLFSLQQDIEIAGFFAALFADVLAGLASEKVITKDVNISRFFSLY